MEWMTDLLNAVRQLASGSIIFSVGIMLVTGYFLGKLFQCIRLPSITGYIAAGLLLGHSLTGIISGQMEKTLSSLTEVALGLIALTIGAEFDISRMRRTGRKLFIIALFQALLPFLLVAVLLNIIGMDLRYSFLLGSIAIATAPAATVIIIKELRARGEFVDYVYGIVAIDDALCVVFFGIVFAVIGPTLGSTAAEGGILTGLLHAFRELILSALLGFLGGITLHFLTFKKYKKNEIQIISLAIIFLVIGFAVALHLSLLIANMIFGATIVNFSVRNRRIFSILEPLTPPVFAFFFILAGMELSLDIFTQGTVVLMGLVYVLTRVAGRVSGVYLGAVITGMPDSVRRYMGLCFTPQAGVAIGLALFMQSSPVMVQAPVAVKQALVMMVNVILFSVFVNEFVGPPVSRYGIIRGADLQ